jgi:NDP-sugar pyrophosphorylase family protein
MNILFPIAGRGSRFKLEYDELPKPLVLVKGKTLLEHSVESLKINGHFIFIFLKYENKHYNYKIRSLIEKLKPGSKIIMISKITRGAAETCLYAKDYIDNEDPLLITNCDQYLNWNPNKLYDIIKTEDPDACVSLYDHEDIEVGKPGKYAYVSLDDQGKAIKFNEKFAISKNALNGIHYWKRGRDFISSVKKMIEDKVVVNNEYYISPSFNYMIKEGKNILTFKMEKKEYLSLGSPEEIQKNLKFLYNN